jgi:class 3 adenylate cyclase
VQLRELTRFLLSQINDRAPMADILGFTENLERRFTAHEADLVNVYFSAAAPLLAAHQWKILQDAAPSP